MKIVYLYTQLTISGGADRVLTDKANYLAEHGYNITIITESQMGRPIVFPLSPKVKMVDMGIDFNKQYEYNFLLRSVIYLKCIQQYKIRLKELLKKLKNQKIFLNIFFMMMINLLLLKLIYLLKLLILMMII
jgi:hypothetical protein